MFLIALSAIFLFPQSLSAQKRSKTSTAKINSTFSKPDFAYPKTVIEDARTALAKACKSGNNVEKLQAAMQLAIAENLISTDSIGARISMIDSLSRTLPQPYRSVGLLLEASVYDALYNTDRWQFSRRKLPLSTYPDSPMEWSGDLFAKKINELLTEANADLAALANTGIGEIAPLLSGKKSAYENDFATVADFVAAKSIDILSDVNGDSRPLIPFRAGGANRSVEAIGSELILSIFDRIIDLNIAAGRDDTAVWFIAMRSQRMGDGADSYLRKWRDILSDSPACIYLLARLNPGIAGSDAVQAGDKDAIRRMEQVKIYYDELQGALSRFPNSRFAPDAKNVLGTLGERNITFDAKSQYLSDRDIEIPVVLANTTEAYALLYRVAEDGDNRSLKNILKQGKPVGAYPVRCSGNVPFVASDTLRIPNPGYGKYALIPSLTASPSGVINRNEDRWINLFRVSDLEIIAVSDSKKEDNNTIYVADARTLRPIEGAKVNVRSRNKRESSATLTTDANGAAKVTNSSADIIVSRGKDTNAFSFYYYKNSEKLGEQLKAQVLTDLSLYHPGDTVGFSAVVYRVANHNATPAADKQMLAIVHNANWQPVDTLELTTDRFGRLSGKTVLPSDGLLGRWNIALRDKYKSSSVATAYINVAEYKAPTFLVDIDRVEPTYTAGDTIRIGGIVRTYSGMPVADADIAYDLEFAYRYMYHGGRNPYFGATTTSGPDGRFEIELPTSELEGTPYICGGYRLNVTATSPGGESQQAAPVSFTLGNTDFIDTSALRDIYKVEADSVALSIPVGNIIGRDVPAMVNYTLTGENGKTLSGSFTAPTLNIPAAEIPSGKYTLAVALAADPGISDTASIVFYRPSDKNVPVATPLWVPDDKYYGKAGSNVAIRFGNSYPDSYILCVTSDVNGVVDRKWLKTNGKLQSMDVRTPASDNKVWLKLFGCHDLDNAERTVQVFADEALTKLKIKTVSFRDNIVPGSREKWTFRFLLNDKAPGEIPVMAVMTDKALNAISPFTWTLNPRGSIGFSNPLSLNATASNRFSSTFSLSTWKFLQESGFSLPEWQTYGYPLIAGNAYGMVRGIKMERSAARTMTTNQQFASADMAVEESVEEEVAAPAPAETAGSMKRQANGAEGGAGGVSLADVAMSDAEHPLAFFMPSLITDADGNVTLDFTVPQFSTTWQLQIAGYTPGLYSAVETFNAVSSRPVMVKANLPRFVRTGDEVVLRSTLMNNTGEMRSVGGVIELFDPQTSAVISRKEFAAADMAAHESRVVAMPFSVPADRQVLGVRCYALSDEYADGEQAAIHILPSSSPVIESTPFYLGLNDSSFEIKLPKYRSSDNVTLQYCDNPVWYCATALPDLSDGSSASIFSKVSALFGNAVASKVVSRFPAIGKALDYWQQGLREGTDSTLVSNLQKDAALKSVALQNTPWVNNAASETLRMERLHELLDADRSAKACDRLVSGILELQKGDGGWSWVPQMESSAFVTGKVLLNLAMMKQMDCLPADPMLDKGIASAVAFCDKNVYAAYLKSKKRIDVASALSWLYIRSNFEVAASRDFARYRELAVAEIASSWKKMDIYDKATAAILLARSGKKNVALQALESLRQYAVVTPQRGMYFDNVSSGFSPFTRLITTTQVLEAFVEILPDDEAVDRLRQWLILQRQTEDWGDNRHAAEVVYAILSCGADWTQDAAPADIYLGSRKLDADAAKYTGALTLQLDAAEASGKVLRVERSSQSPAWGGVIAQYVAPAASVKAEKCDALSISKQIYALDVDGNGAVLSSKDLQLGQKVRVTLTVTNSSDLQYVAITDERGACMEPADQLSAYTMTDGIYAYRETRNSQTSFMIGFLPKGTHQFTYDCYISQQGDFTVGIATAQSLYAPAIVAHSAGKTLTVNQPKN